MFYPVSAQFWAFYPLLPLVVNNSASYGSKMFGWLVISLTKVQSGPSPKPASVTEI
ncbi:hypothetical protein V12G01_02430 [Vibrio alginolyticus 12G01]|nr:hypothetical protein V12G01_02430 [Vibrio alginolyticus 12G01]